jgi:hypothetical protein
VVSLVLLIILICSFCSCFFFSSLLDFVLLLHSQTTLLQLHSILLQINLQSWKYVIIMRFNLQNFPIFIPSINWSIDKIHRSTRLCIALTCSVCQCLGKKTFGKTASDLLECSVAFLETCTNSDVSFLKENLIPSIAFSSVGLTSSDNQLRRIHSINPNNSLTLLLFDSNGLKFIHQVLELSRILAESTAASGTTVNQQIQSTYRLILAILPYLTDERVCSELLQMVREMTCVFFLLSLRYLPGTVVFFVLLSSFLLLSFVCFSFLFIVFFLVFRP